MKSVNVGQRVTVEGEAGRVYALDHEWAAVILDKESHRVNPPIFWAKISELTEEQS